jgi:hypothetical protein
MRLILYVNQILDIDETLHFQKEDRFIQSFFKNDEY